MAFPPSHHKAGHTW